jgi:hypothetical protein
MRYTSPEDARSDLFLSAAVYLFGPLIVGLVLQLVPLGQIPGVAAVLSIALPIVFTALVPYLLIRYRKESLRDYLQGTAGVTLGLWLAVPILVAAGLVLLLQGDTLQLALPVARVTRLDGAFLVAQELVQWAGLAALAWYATIKAQDAFRLQPQTIQEATAEIGRILAIVAVVSILLLSLTPAGSGLFARTLTLACAPLGIAGAVVLALRRLRSPSSTSRSVLLTPTVLLALGVFQLTLDPRRLVPSLYLAALFGGVGLLIGLIHESRKSFYAVLALAAVVALLSPALLVG